MADPLEDFSFVVQWGGVRTGMLRVGPLKLSTAVTIFRESSNATNASQKIPGLTTYEPVVFEREIVHGDLDFQVWASQVAGGGGFRRDVAIQLLDASHNPVVRFNLKNCWPSAYEAETGLNSEDTRLAIERLTVEFESFVRVDS